MKIREIGVLVSTLFIILLFAAGCFNKPPNVPDIVSAPESTFTRAQTLVRVATTDPNNNAVYYIMDWGDGIIDTFPNEEGASPYVSGETTSVSHLYSKWSPADDPHEKTFEIKASAKDDKGKIQKNWSDAKSIRVVYNDEPNRPSIIPVHDTGAIKTPQPFKAIAIDNQNDSISYHFSFFGANEWTRYYRSGDTISDYGTFPTAGTKKVWVIAKDTKGSQSFSSDTANFMAIDEGYVTKVFQAVTRADEGEVDTVGLQSSPAIAIVNSVEEIFIGSEGGQLYGITASNLDRDWYKYPEVEEAFDEDPWGNTAAVNTQTNHLYIANDQGELYCWSLQGDEQWRYPNALVTALTNWDLTDAAFNKDNGYVYVVNRDYDSLYVLTDASGTKAGYYVGFSITVAPTIDAGGNVYIGDDSGYVYKLPASGNNMTPVWKIKLNGSISTSPIIDASGIIYVGANVPLNGYLYALNPDSSIKWTYTIGDNILTQPVIGTDNNIYFCDDGGKVHSVDASSGTLKLGWSLISLNANASSPAFAADGKFYLLTDDQRVFCINTNGTVRWESQLPVTGVKKYRKLREDLIPSPTIGGDGSIYVATGEDDIGLYQLKGRSAGTPASTAWPMYRHDRNHSGKAGFTPGR
jgi:PQQ-like domain